MTTTQNQRIYNVWMGLYSGLDLILVCRFVGWFVVRQNETHAFNNNINDDLTQKNDAFFLKQFIQYVWQSNQFKHFLEIVTFFGLYAQNLAWIQHWKTDELFDFICCLDILKHTFLFTYTIIPSIEGNDICEF